MKHQVWERISFEAMVEPVDLENEKSGSPFLCIGYSTAEGAYVKFFAFPDHGYRGKAEWQFKRPLRPLLVHWREMFRDYSTGEFPEEDLSDPELKLLTKLIAAYDSWAEELGVLDKPSEITPNQTSS